ncbi:MAG: hypothetical protein OEY85_11895, partial [Rhodospirillales bacterium]|nr:hypothetical protein [Rhodospirillales bacterium]
DMLSALGPLAPPARTALGLARTVFARAESDLNTLRDALLAPARRHGEAQSARLEALENRINELPQGRGRSRSREASQ